MRPGVRLAGSSTLSRHTDGGHGVHDWTTRPVGHEGRVVGTSKSWSAMGAESSSMKPEGDVQRPPSASTVATEPEHPLRPQPPPGHAHPASRSASLGRSASGGNGLNRMGSDPHLHTSGQRRHHTWHNAPKKRVYDQSVWDLQALVARRASTHPACSYLHVYMSICMGRMTVSLFS